MATSRAQRTGIWVITVAMMIGTVVGFLAMILSSQNQTKDQQIVQQYQAKYTAYQKDTTDQQTAIDKQAKALSSKYYASFAAQKARVAKFDAKSVKKLSVATLQAGDGATITNNTTYLAYYIGFTPDGKIFDSSLDKNSLKSPFIVRPGGTISGWNEGMQGKKIGGIYELTIPSEQAYGAAGSGSSIKPNTPLKFVVMPIKTITTYQEPQATKEILDAYAATQQ